jgi:hypothetical protein
MLHTVGNVYVQFSSEKDLTTLKKELAPFKVDTDFQKYGYINFYKYKKYNLMMTFNDTKGVYILGIGESE